MTDATTPDATTPDATNRDLKQTLAQTMTPSIPPVTPSATPVAEMTRSPREYPQALRGPLHRWWRPLLSLAVVLAGVAVLFGAMLLYIVALILAQALGLQVTDPTSVSDAWFVTPVGLLVTNLSLALGIPLALAATWAQAKRAGLVSSVVGRVRWRLLLGGLGLALLLLVPLTLGGDLLMAQLGFTADDGGTGPGVDSGADESGWWPLTPAASWMALAVVILLTTPLQAAGEEYFFRGWLSQWIGSWLRWRWLAVVVPAVVTAILFALAHGAQSPWLFADRLVFGLIASLLVWRTGGLELAVGLHAANNLLAFGLAIAYDGLEESLLITDVAPVEGAVSITVTIITTAVLLWWARRREPVRVATDPAVPVLMPAGPAAPGVAPVPASGTGPRGTGPRETGAGETGPGEAGPTNGETT